jgi:hypothetical protein
MPDMSRRRFLRNASLATAAAGAVAVAGPSAFGLGSAPAAAAATGAHGSEAQAAFGPSPQAGDEVMAHVVDEASGTIALYAGTRKVTLQDRAVTEALLRALR